jgi:hypothetical protein
MVKFKGGFLFPRGVTTWMSSWGECGSGGQNTITFFVAVCLCCTRPAEGGVGLVAFPGAFGHAGWADKEMAVVVD